MLEFKPDQDFRLLLLALFLPLVGYVIQIFFGRKLPRQGDWMLIGGMAVTAAITVLMFAKSLYAAYHGQEFRWHSGEHAGMWFHWLYSSAQAAGGTENVVVGLFYDPLGAAMLAVVGVVSFCVHLFSSGYMHGDKRYPIFFANLSLFTFAMLGLVLADNILFLFVFWEVMGLMSYLLISHFAHDQKSGFHGWATWASKKAFMTTRVGDVCLLVGILMFHHHFHTFRFTELWEAARLAVAANGGEFPAWMTVAGLFTFGGTVGKSAQFPLHIWLPDAMAGPTPVSAMIHAATMVAAGVFLLGRMYPLFSPELLTIVTVVGAFTALFAASIGTTAWDLKAVLAWSTISQLGFMVAAVGLGSVTAGMFHMVTHAFFKACLFLSAGSVIHGCHHEQDMRLMGGLRRKMPVTFACMLICTLAIAGIPFFSGFYSKDMILMAGYEQLLEPEHFGGTALFATLALSCAAFMTAFYMFRMIFLTFFGEYRGHSQGGVYRAQLVAHGRGGHIVYHDDLGKAGNPSDLRLHAQAAAHTGHGHEDHGHAAPRHGGHDAHGHAGHGHEHDHGHGHEVHGHEDHGHAGHGHAHEPHESPLNITLALCVLALLGWLGGHFWLLGDPMASHTKPWFVQAVSERTLYGAEVAEWIAPQPVGEAAIEHAHHVEHTAHSRALYTSLFVATSGILLAFLLYVAKRAWPPRIARSLGLVYETVRDRYYFDELVRAAVIEPSFAIARGLALFDRVIVDGLVNLVGRTGRGLGFLSAWFDRTFVDGAVNGVGAVTQVFGSAVRLLQSGRVQQYAACAVAGGLAAAVWLILL
jgi:NADH-quinone oxidoreductase subunit L